MKLRLPIVVVMLFLLILILPFFVSQVESGTSTIWTDKDDYGPEQTVTIFGSGFLANKQVAITITAPDSSVATIYVTTDGSGAFTAYYTLDGMEGTYTVAATDGTNTATTTFTDSTSRYFTATISPNTAITGETKSYNITITNDMSSSSGVLLGSAKIAVPSGFTIISSLSVSYPPGKPWTATLVSGYIKLNTTADSYRLSRGQSVSVTFSATAPGTAGTYTWTTSAWVDRSYGSGTAFILKSGTTQPKVTVSTAATVSITITSSPVTGSGFVKVDGSATTTPYTFTWTIGGTHSLQALSPVADGTGKQYVFTSWSAPSFGSSTSQTYTYTVPSSAETVTANYKTQYQHTITSSPATGSGYVTVDGSAVTTPYTTPWWDSGSSHTIAANSPVVITTNQEQYVYLSWSDSGAQSHSVSPTSVTTFTATFTHQWYFLVSSSYDSPTGTGWYNAGSSCSGSTISRPVSGGTGIQYETTGWTGTGSLSSGGSAGSSSIGSFTISAYSTCTWNWKTQYRQDVSSSYDSPTNNGVWYDAGATASSSVTSPVSGGTGIQYVCNHHTGTGSAPTGSGVSVSYTINAYSTVTFDQWTTQYYFTVSSTYDSATGQGWYNSGSSVSSSVTRPVSGGTGIQYETTGWTGSGSLSSGGSSGSSTTESFTITAVSSCTWNWKTQYYLTVSTAYSTQTGQGWYDSGSTAYAGVSSSPVSGGTGIQYVFTSWSGDASGSNYAQSNGITMNGAKTATAGWKTQYYFTVSSLYDSPTGQAWYDSGSSVSSTVTRPVSGGTGIQYETTGWTGTGSLSSGGTAGSSSIGSFTINAYSTCTWNWKTQYQLTMGTNFGTTSPSVGDHWYEVGTPVPIQAFAPSVITGEQYVWNGWTGTGTVSYTGTANPSSVTLNGPISETASWTHQFLLTIKTSGLPSVYPTKVYLAGSQVGSASDTSSYTKWFDAETPTGTIGVDNTISGAAGTRYVFVKWVEGSSTNNPRSSENMDSPKTFTAEYKTQYQITVTASPSGALGGTFKVTYTQCGTTYTNVQKTTSWTEWADGTTTVTVSEPQDTIDISLGARYKFDYYNPSATVTMDQAKSITLVYKTQYLVSFTQTGSALAPTVTYTADTDPTGTVPFGVWVKAGSQIIYTYQNIVPGAPGVRYVFTSVTPTSPQTVNGPLTINGAYKTQYLLTVLTDPAGLSPQPTRNPAGEAGPANGWWYDTTSVTLTAQTVTGYNFNYWDVDGNSQGNGVNPISVITNAPHTATAHYTPVITYTLTITATTGGTTNPAPGTHTYSSGTTVDVTATPNAGYRFDHWVLNGSDAGSTNPISLLMDRNRSLQAVFAETHTLTIGVSQGGTTNPAPGTYTYQTPTDVSVTATPYAGYRLDYWLYNNNNIGSQNTVTVHVGSSHTLKAVFVLSCPSPVGGYSISLIKQTPVSHMTAYTMLIALFGVVLILIKRKRK